MAALPTKTFTTIVSDAVTAVQGAAQQLLDLTVGSVLRAFLEATSGIALWLQGMALQIAALTRFATSSGTDADSWGDDFDYARLAAQFATCTQIQLGRFTPTGQAVVPNGSIVQTQDGSQQYAVIADAAQGAYNASLLGYLIPAGTASILVTVQALTAGSQANVGAGLVNALGSAIVGVDTVTNLIAITNGNDAETDPAYKARFPFYINSLAKGTVGAIEAAIANLQQGVFAEITENMTYGGIASNGYFYVVVDDGTGAPSASFLSMVYSAVDAVRPITSTFSVFPPILLPANISLSLTVAAGYNKAALDALVVTALQNYIATLEIGATLPFTRLAQIAYDASAGITNVSGVTLNGSTADLVADNKSVIRAGTMSIL